MQGRIGGRETRGAGACDRAYRQRRGELRRRQRNRIAGRRQVRVKALREQRVAFGFNRDRHTVRAQIRRYAMRNRGEAIDADHGHAQGQRQAARSRKADANPGEAARPGRHRNARHVRPARSAPRRVRVRPSATAARPDRARHRSSPSPESVRRARARRHSRRWRNRAPKSAGRSGRSYSRSGWHVWAGAVCIIRGWPEPGRHVIAGPALPTTRPAAVPRPQRRLSMLLLAAASFAVGGVAHAEPSVAVVAYMRVGEDSYPTQSKSPSRSV